MVVFILKKKNQLSMASEFAAVLEKMRMVTFGHVVKNRKVTRPTLMKEIGRNL